MIVVNAEENKSVYPTSYDTKNIEGADSIACVNTVLEDVMKISENPLLQMLKQTVNSLKLFRKLLTTISYEILLCRIDFFEKRMPCKICIC